MRDLITYPFPLSIEVWDWISYFTHTLLSMWLCEFNNHIFKINRISLRNQRVSSSWASSTHFQFPWSPWPGPARRALPSMRMTLHCQQCGPEDWGRVRRPRGCWRCLLTPYCRCGCGGTLPKHGCNMGNWQLSHWPLGDLDTITKM